MQTVQWESLNMASQLETLGRPQVHRNEELKAGVEKIVSDVRQDGDDAVRRLTAQFDRADIDGFRVTGEELAAAEAALPAAAVDAIEVAIANVREFHRAQLPHPIVVETMPGVRCERISHPLDAVGLYVPAGSAPLPSTAIMLAVPAALAGCPRRVMCTPPRTDGTADPGVLVAARRAGVSEIYKIGGAQAVAAMAFGTESVPKVNRIFGPGNAWVTEAKQQVAALPGGAAIDMPAGPSEVLVIADDEANAEFVAADLLSQAEHGVDSQVILVTTSDRLARDVIAQVEAQLPRLARADTAKQALESSRAIVCESLDTATAISNRYAPEHLILHVTEPRRLLDQVRNAGSVFLGPWSPESVGDYCSGTNHVLPTYGTASTYSGLSIEQFMRHMTVQELSPAGLDRIGGAVIELAKLEGLDAHAAAVTRRLAASGSS